MDKVTTALLAAVKEALIAPGEQRLFRSGKLAGLFASRLGATGEAAERAVREGMLEIVRTEQKGKTTMDWVRATSKAVDFIHEHEAPVVALHELQHILQSTQLSLPLWMADIQGRLEKLTSKLTGEVENISQRLQALSRRVEDAITRVESAKPIISRDVSEQVPWAHDVLAYLERRRGNGTENPCALPELFGSLAAQNPPLTVTAFHAGMRRLFDRGIVRLLPHDGGDVLPEPEFALLDGFLTYYYVARSGNKAA